MFNSWFPNGIFRRHKVANGNLQQRIMNLMGSAKETEKNFSPTLNELKSHKNKVKRMSSCYEENIAAFNESNNNSKFDKTSFSGKLDGEGDETTYVSFSDTTLFFTPKARFPTKVEGSIQSMIKADASYIKHMELLISRYVNQLDSIPALRSAVPAIKAGHKEHLFGKIEKIYDLHKEKFHPMLLACSDDILAFAKGLTDLCKEGFFNAYVIYAMDEKACEHRRNVFYHEFIQGIMDKVGFPFTFSPVQQMARYHLIIIDMLCELHKIEASQELIVALSTAEIHWKSVMNKLYAMRNMAD